MQDLRRLRWQCRRGVKELDSVLCDYLDNHYIASTAYEQSLFVKLLSLEDDQLLMYFFANNSSEHYVNNYPNIEIQEDQELRQFIEKIRITFMG